MVFMVFAFGSITILIDLVVLHIGLAYPVNCGRSGNMSILASTCKLLSPMDCTTLQPGWFVMIWQSVTNLCLYCSCENLIGQ